MFRFTGGRTVTARGVFLPLAGTILIYAPYDTCSKFLNPNVHIVSLVANYDGCENEYRKNYEFPQCQQRLSRTRMSISSLNKSTSTIAKNANCSTGNHTHFGFGFPEVVSEIRNKISRTKAK